MKVNKKTLKQVTLVMLIDFQGHPSIAVGEEMNTLRFEQIKQLAFDSNGSIVIVDNTLEEHKSEAFKEINRLVNIENTKTWFTIDPDNPKIDIPYIVTMLIEKGYTIRNVIVGGCNTSGCIAWSKPYSATKWAKAGFDTTIWLPICADYQLAGATVSHTNMLAYEILFNYIKNTKTIDNINIVANYANIDIAKRNEK